MTVDGNSEPEPVLSPQSPPELTLEDVEGLDDELVELQETVLGSADGTVTPEFRLLTGLVYGKPGAGKRRLVRAVAGELGSMNYSFAVVDSLSQSHRSGSEVLERLFDEAIDHQPIVIVLDCFDHFLSSDVVRAFESRIDTIRNRGDEVIVLSVVDNRELHQPAVQDYVRAVDVVLELERPDLDRRRAIIRDRLSEVSRRVDDVDAAEYDFDRLARETDQFGVDDLDAVARRVALTARTDVGAMPPVTEADVVDIASTVDEERLEKIQDEATLTSVDVPSVTFDDVGGHEEAKRKLVEHVEQALGRPDLAEDLGVDFGGGVLLHGPPGTGKTMLVRALANELDYTFIPVNTPALKSGRGGPANQIPMLFYRAQRNAPAIVFFDEFDSIGTRRGSPLADESAVNTLLTELDGVERLDRIVTIAATNRPGTLDPALLRPGRFNYHVEIGTPDAATQAEIFEKQTSELPLAEDVTSEWFAVITDDVTGADIAAICDRAVTVATRNRDAAEAHQIELSRNTFERAYEEFEEGRLHQQELDSSPTFY